MVKVSKEELESGAPNGISRRKRINAQRGSQEDDRVTSFIESVEYQMEYLADETRSLGYLGVQIHLEILKELRRQRGVI